MIYYSPATNTFFDDTISAPIPDDVRTVTKAEHTALFEAQANGQCITADAQGRPVAIDRPGLTAAELLDRLRRQRDQLLRDSDRTQIPDYPISDGDRIAWATYRQQLRDLPETITDPAAVVWPTPPAEEGATA